MKNPRQEEMQERLEKTGVNKIVKRVVKRFEGKSIDDFEIIS